MFIANQKVLGLPVNPKKIWVLSIAGMLLLIGLGEFLPYEGVQMGIAVGSVFAVRNFIRYSHAPAINKYVSSGGQSYPIGRSIVIALISLLATLALVTPFVIL